MPAPLLDASDSAGAERIDAPSTRRLRGLRRGRSVFGIALVCGALVLSGCGDDGGSEDSSDAGSDAVAGLPEVADSEYEDMTGESEIVIDVRDNTFGPQYVTVSPGTTVTFSNGGRNPHNVIAVENGAFPDIPTEDLQPGAESEISIDDAGDYPYYCSLHATPSRGMTGRIRVADA